MNEIVSKHKLPARPLYVRAIRDFLFRVLIEHGATEREALEVKAAFSEAANNIIEHAYRNEKKYHFIAEFHIRADTLEIVLIDYGIRVPRSKIKARRLDDYYSSGLGIFLMEQFTDFLNYDTSGDRGTRLTMIRKIPGLKV